MTPVREAPSRPPVDAPTEPLIGHPVVALARWLGCTEGQLYTMVTGVVVAILLALTGAHPSSGNAPSAPFPSYGSPAPMTPGSASP